jgi:hypothetical protein
MGDRMMRKTILTVALCCLTLPALSTEPDSRKIEQDLQRLSWPQFRTVVEAIPKLKADIEAYGPFGWQYVQKNYQTHGWRKNIGKLDEAQKQQLVELIANVRRPR